MLAIDEIRLAVARETPEETKAGLGQYMTPYVTADFLASMFDYEKFPNCKLLDPGAGIGSLTIAFLRKAASRTKHMRNVWATTCEIDSRMRAQLEDNLSSPEKALASVKIVEGDFIENAVEWLQFVPNMRFTHAIINPPYKKISSSSRHRKLLRAVDIETVNLYSAFVALALQLLQPGGELVAIIPRSFCNGPYYKPFRELLLSYSAIRQIHLYHSRTQMFKDDQVLQENIIIKLERDARQENVIVSSSSNDSLTDYVERSVPFSQVVHDADLEKFIHIPVSDESNEVTSSALVCHTLEDLGLKVSTGPVVDFRVKEYLSTMPTKDSVPLLYPVHMGFDNTEWPKLNSKKSNALLMDEKIQKLLYPMGYYCVVKRFSSKEEKRRITASVVNPDTFGDVPALGFENHLNVFHSQKSGIPKQLAYGLAVFLNSSVVDQYFRSFNGHTQVNATDLKQMRYPDRDFLMQLGQWAIQQKKLTQEVIDSRIGGLI